MIKYCNECKYYKVSGEYPESKCFNPEVNKTDHYMLAHKSGRGYGTSCTDQRRNYSWPLQDACGTQGKYWVSKSEVENLIEL